MEQHDSGVYEVAGPALTDIIRSVISEEDCTEVMAAAVNRCGALVHADGALVLVWDSFGVLLRGSRDRTHAARAEVRAVSSEASRGIAGAVAQSREAALVPDVHADSRFDAAVDAPDGVDARSLVSVPLIAHRELLGVLQAVRGPARRPFEPTELELLETVAPHVAIAVFNALTMKRLREAQAAAAVSQAELEKQVQHRTVQLVRAKREWESTVDAISEPLALLRDFTVARANLAFGERAGVEIRHVPGRRCYELLAHRTTPCPGCPVADEAGVASPRNAEVRMGRRHYQVSAFPVGDGATVVHYRDVTDQRQLEAQLANHERLAAVGRLASGAAHEINNPLAIVIANLRVLEAELGEAGPLRDAVTDALSGAERVRTIVLALRSMSRQHLETFETVRLRDSATRALRTVLGASAAVDTELTDEGRARVAPLLLDQALAAILENARQAVSGTQRIHVSTGGDPEDVWVRVSDEGDGIAPANLPRIFEPFFTTRGVGGGLGLGLTAAWNIVTAFHGRIDVDSALGRGTTVTVRLPRAPAPVEAGGPGLEHPWGLG